MLKLFRDYLFHQVTEEGRPWLDMSHIVQTLNKLDSGSSDTVNYKYISILFFVYLLILKLLLCFRFVCIHVMKRPY